jgi:hypothetical protein
LAVFDPSFFSLGEKCGSKIEMNYTITLEENPQIEDIQTIRQNIVTFNRIHTGIDDYKPLVLILRDALGNHLRWYRNLQIVGGLVGETYLGTIKILKFFQKSNRIPI